MPLDAQAIAALWDFNRLDDAIRRSAANDNIIADGACGLVMGAVDVKLGGSAGEAMEKTPGFDFDHMAGLGSRVGLLMGERIRDLIGNMLNERAAESDIQELLTAANAENWQVSVEKTIEHREFEGRSPILGDDRIMSRGRSIERWVDIERAACNDQPVKEGDIILGELNFMGERDGQAASISNGGAIIVPNSIPREVRKTTRRFSVQGKTDARPATKHGDNLVSSKDLL